MLQHTLLRSNLHLGFAEAAGGGQGMLQITATFHVGMSWAIQVYT